MGPLRSSSVGATRWCSTGRTSARFDGIGIARSALGILHGDLSLADETADVAEQANAIGAFDAVIHNAGTMDVGIAATNVVAPYLLSALMDRRGRLIVLSSSMHLTGRADLVALTKGDLSYSDSKLLVTALVMALGRRWPATLAHAVDPGWVPTRMGGVGATDDLAAGHETQTWLAVAHSREITPRTGGYWHHKRTLRPHPQTFQHELIATLADLTGVEIAER